MTIFKIVLTGLVHTAVNDLLHPNLQEINMASVHVLVTLLSQVSQTLLYGLAVPHEPLASMSSSRYKAAALFPARLAVSFFLLSPYISMKAVAALGAPDL